MLTREKIIQIRAEAQKTLTTLKDRVATMEAKLELMDDFLREIPSDDKDSENSNRFSRMSLAKAVIKACAESEHPQGLTVVEIKDELIRGGHKTKSKSFYTSVYNTCKRLRKGGKVEEGVKDDKRSFYTAESGMKV